MNMYFNIILNILHIYNTFFTQYKLVLFYYYLLLSIY